MHSCDMRSVTGWIPVEFTHNIAYQIGFENPNGNTRYAAYHMPSNDSLERVVLNLMSLFGKGVPELSADKMKNIFTDPKSATQQ